MKRRTKKTKAKKIGASRPLECKVVNNELVIRVGIDTLAFAAENGPFNAFSPSTNDYRNTHTVENKAEFANDVALEILREEEDGSSPLTNFLDEMIIMAADNGSLGLSE